MTDRDDKLVLEIITPERRVLVETVDEVVLPGEEGYFGVRPGHAPLLARLAPGQIECRGGERPRLLAVSRGYAEVQRDRVTVLAETCEAAEEIDPERARRARDRAEALVQRPLDEDASRDAHWALKRAINRLRTHERGRGMMH